MNHANTAIVTTAGRVDLYADIHKALRAAMGETLTTVGRADPDDNGETAAALATVRDLLALCTSHVDKEEHHVHPAIEARAPDVVARIAGEHVQHLQAIADLEEDVRVVEAASSVTRDAAMLRLYRRLSAFVAENFEHMLVEESVHNAALWTHYDDGELIAIHDRLVASIPPAEMMGVLRWMAPSITAGSRARMFAGMRAGMPAEAFDGVLGFVEQHLAAGDRTKLRAALRAC